MSFTRSKQAEIKNYILKQIEMDDPALIQRIMAAYGASDKTVYRYLKELEQAGAIVKNGRKYSLVSESHEIKLSLNEVMKKGEDTVFYKSILPLLSGLSENTTAIWEYAVTGMLNNVIEHSEAKHLDIYLIINPISTAVIIHDDGIGIFKKLRKNLGLQNNTDALLTLYKGKITLSGAGHSGEGIYFVSQMLDSFAIISDHKIFSHEAASRVTAIIERTDQIKKLMDLPGTIAYMVLKNNSEKQTGDVLRSLINTDGSLGSTTIPLCNIYETMPVSRAQAKRLFRCLENFREVILDFEGIDFIGQSFAHELFAVYAQDHPETKLVPAKMNDDIRFMISHVIASKP